MLDGFVYAVGGWEGRSRLDSVECYNPHTNSWQFTESVKMAVTSPAVVALDGLLYVTGAKRRSHSVKTFSLGSDRSNRIFYLFISGLLAMCFLQVAPFWRTATAQTWPRCTTPKPRRGRRFPRCRSPALAQQPAL